MPALEGLSSAGRSRVRTRTARPDDLAAVLALVRQHHAEAGYEVALTGQGPGAVAAAGFRRLLTDPSHRVVLAVLPGPNAHDGQAAGEQPVGLAVPGSDPLPVVLGTPQVTIEWFVVHRDHRRGAPASRCWRQPRPTRRRPAPTTSSPRWAATRPSGSASSPGMGFAPLSTRRIVGREQLSRQLPAWQRNGLALPEPRRSGQRRRLARPRTLLTAAEG